MAHKPHRDKKVSRKRRGRDGRKHMAWAYWWLGLNSLLSVGLCQLEPPKQEIVPVHWWKESVVFLLFPLLPLVWFRLNSLPRSCLPTPELQFFIVFLFFRIPPFNPWGFLHWARSAQLCWAALWSFTTSTIPSARLPCVSHASLFAASHPRTGCLLFSSGSLGTIQPGGQREIKGHFRLAGRRVGLQLSFFLSSFSNLNSG